MNCSPTLIADAIRKANRVFLVGNGGSYANASHIANDLLSCGVSAFTLDPSSLTASANDFGYETVFARWIETVGAEGDLLVALSGSGKSPNILQALAAAKKKKMDWILVTDHLITRNMQESEEDQIVLGHELMRLLRDAK